MELKGTIIVIGNTEEFGAKGFKKRQVVIKTDAQYPQTIPVDFTQDKCKMLDSYNIGDFVDIAINIQGTEWKGKYYANIQGWKINKGEAELNSDKFMPDRVKVKLNGDMANEFNDAQDQDFDDLPF
jgi:formylmethanofuran dehydrogenase subunit C